LLGKLLALLKFVTCLRRKLSKPEWLDETTFFPTMIAMVIIGRKRFAKSLVLHGVLTMSFVLGAFSCLGGIDPHPYVL
jgi:hypothetical protein